MCVIICDYIWLYMIIYDYICYIWLYMIIYDYIWLYMIIYDYIWLYMIIYDYICLYMIIYDYMWLYMIICDYIWLYMIICVWMINSHCKVELNVDLFLVNLIKQIWTTLFTSNFRSTPRDIMRNVAMPAQLQ